MHVSDFTGMEQQEGEQDWSDPAFRIPSDEETPEEFHGFGSDTVIQGRLIVGEAGGNIQVTRTRRLGRPKQKIRVVSESPLVLNYKRREEQKQAAIPAPNFSRRSARLAPPTPPTPPPRKRGRPRSGEVAPPPPKQETLSGPVSLPKAPAGTGSRPSLYLLDKPKTDPLTKTKLPKGKQILQRLQGLLLEKKTEKDAIKEVTKECVEVWEHHFGLRVIEGKEYKEETVSEKEMAQKKMIRRNHKIYMMIEKMHNEYKRVEHQSRKVVQNKNFNLKEEEFRKTLDRPLNIMKMACVTVMIVDGVKQSVRLPSGEEILATSGILDWQEDLKHLRNQLTVEQPGCCDSFDMRQDKRDKRKIADVISEQKRRKMCKDESEKFFEKAVIGEYDSDEEACDDGDFKVNKQERKIKKIDVMGPVAATADRLNLSCRAMAMSSAATAKALGVKVSDTNISRSTAWRKRTMKRKETVDTIKESFVPYSLSGLHWDGKSLWMARKEKGTFVAVYLTGVEEGHPRQLLGIPRAPGGTGFEEFSVIKNTVEDWKQIEKKTIGSIVFDTTLSNTGELKGVCR